MRVILIATMLVVGFATCSCCWAGHSVTSPDGKLQVDFSLQEGRGYYSVSCGGRVVVARSLLGLVLKEGGNLDGGFRVTGTARDSRDQTWKPVWGEQSRIRDNFNQLTVKLKESQGSGRELELAFRAYDEGAAFRYILPRQAALSDFTITSERTEFQFTRAHKTYPVSNPQDYYKGAVPLGKMKRTVAPLTLEIDDDLVASVTEACMDDYARMRLEAAKEGEYGVVCSLAEGHVKGSTPFESPWRVIMVGKDAGDLIENNYLILNLNPPCEWEDTSWIKPGKVIRIMKFTTKDAKSYVDFAVKHNIQYVHFDWWWYGHPDKPEDDPTTAIKEIDLPAVISYAKQFDIGVIVYIQYVHLETWDWDKVFGAYEKLGIKGVKFGFVKYDSQKWTNWLHDAIRKAAEYHLIVDVHDNYRPSGFRRTCPNLLTMEGIGGDEANPPTEHELIVPFTRYIPGPGDHTLCYYRDNLKKTNAFQLAAAVVFYSPMQYLYWYDTPNESQDEPELKFWDDVPVVWDETKVLNAKIGDYITVARRSGDEWYLGSLADNRNRLLEIPLDFLDVDKKYAAEVYTDAQDADATKYPARVAIDKFTVTRSDTLAVALPASGGQAVRLSPVADDDMEALAEYRHPELQVVTFEVSKRAKADEPFVVKATVKNTGNSMGGKELGLFIDGK